MTLYAMVRGGSGRLRRVVGHTGTRVVLELSFGVVEFGTAVLRIGELHDWQRVAPNEPDVARALEAIR